MTSETPIHAPTPDGPSPELFFETAFALQRTAALEARQKQWYAKLAFPGQKLSQGTDNMWLPVDDLMLIPK
ncbi:MAG: hypothetical protein H0T52_09425 [Lautropia sp.]|nr:hypothetical protein [Lautropia sp.]